MRQLPNFETVDSKSVEDLDTIHSCKADLLKEMSNLTMIDITNKKEIQDFRTYQMKLEGIRSSARKALNSLSNNVTGPRHAVKLGEIKFGTGSSPVEAQITLQELKQVQNLIRI